MRNPDYRAVIRGLVTTGCVLLSGCVIPPAIERSETLFEVCGSGRTNLVVFIHGFTGNPEQTWKNLETGESWPQLMCSDQPFAASATVYAVRYDSSLIRTTSTMSEIAERLTGQLVDRGIFERYQGIYFIGHSMGGLVAKKALVNLYRDRKIDRLRKIRAVLFLATPQQGNPLADWGSLFTMNPLVRGLSSVEFNDYLQTLDDDWWAMLGQRDDQGWTFPLSYCAYEGVRVIVSRTHALTRCDERAVSFPLDHSEIAKPSSSAADVYAWAKARIQNAASRDMSRRPDIPPAVRPDWRAQTPNDAFAFEILEFVEDAIVTSPVAINDLGDMIGLYRLANSSLSQNFLRLANGTVNLIRHPQTRSADGITLGGLNNLGDVVGSYTDSTGIARVLGIVWRRDTKVKTFTCFGRAYTHAAAINDHGQVVGHTLDKFGVRQGFIRETDGKCAALEHPGSFGTGTTPVGITNSGEVVGHWHDPKIGDVGFVRKIDGSFVRIQPDAGTYAYPRAINEVGTVVGETSRGGFLWRSDGSLMALEHPRCGRDGCTKPTGINKYGVIVGGIHIGDGLYVFRATPTPRK